ncbi:MAG: phosphohistidine swiveling domain-containing protein [Candidatus Promineifilaceae bacterium]|jgi:phosphohistidine swiveling domain-containing protein
MSIVHLKSPGQKAPNCGGKANTLAELLQADFPVPDAIALNAPPTSPQAWDAILTWWNTHNNPPLAVRSSACGEDGADFSFAGQHDSLLNVTTEATLRAAIDQCFASTDSQHAKSYRREFGIAKNAVRMNVILQLMVDARYAGVFFSHDPRRREETWLIEYVEGLGEDLVSGRVTPKHLTDEDIEKPEFSPFKCVLESATRAADFLDYPLDMEWAIDKQGRIHILQCRPITTQSVDLDDALRRHFDALRKVHPADTTWDGQPFSEWPGQASRAGCSLWEKAFSDGHAFDSALRELGYCGCPPGTGSLIDRVCGRPFVNLARLMSCFYGAIPCRMIATPEPNLKFDGRQLSLKTVLNLPSALCTMFRVTGRMSSSRGTLLKTCRASLEEHRNAIEKRSSQSIANPTDALNTLRHCYHQVTTHDFKWPLTLIMLIQSTSKTLETHLAKVYGNDKASAKLQEWMAIGLHTETMQMQQALQSAIAHPEARDAFVANYGHRGPGELDLARPRWRERTERLFGPAKGQTREAKNPDQSVDDQIAAITSFRKTLIQQEWTLLRDMLELREAWKMSLMRSFQDIRQQLLLLGVHSELGDSIFHLNIDEILESGLEGLKQATTQSTIEARTAEQSTFSIISLPDVLTLETLNTLLDVPELDTETTQQGVALSPGLAQGVVRVVTGDPSDVDITSWPNDVILVTESTDPGWTPLFAEVRGIVVEKGGVLSHCAIVAREMGIPAVSQIAHCYRLYKDGDSVWVDGLNGTVRFTNDD